MIWDLALAGGLIWLGARVRIRPPGLFALYVCLYSLIRLLLELLRVDPATIILGERLNFWVALAGVIGGAVAFVWIQFVRTTPESDPSAEPEPAA